MLVLLFSTFAASAQLKSQNVSGTLAKFNFNGGDGGASAHAASITQPTFTRSTLLTATNGSLSNTFGASGFSTVIDTSRNFKVVLSPATGKYFRVSGVEIVFESDANGPTLFEITITQGNTVVSSGQNTIVKGASQTATFVSAAAFSSRNYPTVVRVYGYNALTSTGELRLREVNIDGNENSPLPVTLTSFTASTLTHGVKLNWATASELNSASFDVQRSTDGQSFQTIGTVGAAGNSTTPRYYTFNDVTVFPGVKYYRLRQVDVDGTTAFSLVQTVSVRDFSTQIYPTKVVDRLTVRSTERGLGQIYSTQGRLVKQFEVNPGLTELSVSLAPGVYVLRVNSTSNLFVVE